MISALLQSDHCFLPAPPIPAWWQMSLPLVPGAVFASPLGNLFPLHSPS